MVTEKLQLLNSLPQVDVSIVTMMSSLRTQVFPGVAALCPAKQKLEICLRSQAKICANLFWEETPCGSTLVSDH